MLRGYMPLIEISVVILWGAVAVSGQHLQRQIWMSWFWSFMKLKPSSGTRLATLTNIRLKIIAYHRTMSSIYNWEFDSKHLSHLWFGQVSFDHILFLLTMLLTMPLTTMHLIQFWPCLFQRLSCNGTLYDRKWNLRQGQDWTRLVTPHDSLFHMLFKNRMQISCVLKLHCMQFNKVKQQIHCNSFSKLCCSIISAYNFPFTKFTFWIKIASK